MSNEAVTRACDLLTRGELVAIPTETVYGLAGNGTDPEVVTKIYAIKNRPSFDPMILHFGSKEEILPFVRGWSETAEILANAFWPGPLTLLLERSQKVPDIVTAGLPKVAVRIPDHPLTLELLRCLEFPLAAPSANPFGYISPTTAQHVAQQLGEKISYILDGGACQIGLESTIIDVTGKRPKILRKGGVALEAIEAIIGKVEIAGHSSSHPAAPGMLKSHYAPKTRLSLEPLEEILARHVPDKVGGLWLREANEALKIKNQRVLSASGDLNEAARNLFAAMRELDALGLDMIVAELVPDTGLGRAINDKLKRATA